LWGGFPPAHASSARMHPSNAGMKTRIGIGPTSVRNVEHRRIGQVPRCGLETASTDNMEMRVDQAPERQVDSDQLLLVALCQSFPQMGHAK